MFQAVRATLRRERAWLEADVEPTRLVLIFCLLVMIPRYRHFWLGFPGLNQSFVFQVVVAILVILLVYRENPLNWGAGMGDWRTGLLLTGVFMLLYIPAFFAMVTNGHVAAYYRHAEVAESFDWSTWGIQRVVTVLTMTRTEFLYRGFLLYGLCKKFGRHEAIMLHLIPYGIGHLGKPELECYGSLLVGYFLGYLALRVRSIWYGVFLHWFFASAFQLYYVAMLS